MEMTISLPISTYESIIDPDWCPGCGDFGVLRGVKMAAGKLGIKPEELFTVSGIGCSSNLPGYIHAYGVHSLHGRAVAVASGIKFANQDMNVVVTGGDGDGYGIGLGHFVHAMRRNLDLTYIVMNNQIYGLTTGQASPHHHEGSAHQVHPPGERRNAAQPHCAGDSLRRHLRFQGLFGRAQAHGRCHRRRHRPQGICPGGRLQPLRDL